MAGMPLRPPGLAVALACAAIGFTPLPASAQDASDRWIFDIASYGWLTAMTGTTGVGPLRAKVDASFADTVSEADSILAFSGHAEARRGAVAFFVDGMWSRLGFDGLNLGAQRGDATSTLAIAELGGALRLVDGGFDAQQPMGWSLEALAGGRYTYISNSISLSGGGGAETDVHWVDPFVGLRVRQSFSPRWDVSLRGDIGGGSGSGSRFTWNIQALVGYRFTLFGAEATAALGYRALSQDYESAKLVWDMTLHGPVIGLNLRF